MTTSQRLESSMAKVPNTKIKPIELDGSTGEGGGQLVRVAVGLAALTSQPVKIINVRGNRQDDRGGGLKSQHVTAIQWLADVTRAKVDGLFIGSKTLTFIPECGPKELTERSFEVTDSSSTASALLILQAVLPFVIFAGNEAGEPVTLTINGGTNVKYSLSYEYFDQVVMPTLQERFGIRIDRELKSRGWNDGKSARGSIVLKIHPIAKGSKLYYSPPAAYVYPNSYRVETVHVSIVAPDYSHGQLQVEIFQTLKNLFPKAHHQLRLIGNSGSNKRWSVLLVAESNEGIRWATDILGSLTSKKTKTTQTFIKDLSSIVCNRLHKETYLGGHVDENLQDQLVVMQALCYGISSFPRGEHPADASFMAALSRDQYRKDKTDEPFGQGSMHTKTARWVTSQMLPGVKFWEKGAFVEGIGFCV